MNPILPTSAATKGIHNLFDNYIQLKPTDVVIVCYWHECQEYAAWILLELENRNQKYQLYSIVNREKDKFENDILLKINQINFKTEDSRLIILVCEEESLAFSPFLRKLNNEENINVWRIMNTSQHLFEQAFSAKTDDLKKINASLLSHLMDKNVRKIKIKNLHGTDLEVNINNHKYQWISTYGVPGKGELIILPTGEINTFPENINGTFVAFGAIHANIRLPFDTRLETKPVTIEFKNGKIVSFKCQNDFLYNFLEKIFEEKEMTTIGEFGIGTNIGLTHFVANNSHINERFPGVHLGIGMHLQKNNKMYRSDIHMDFISPYGVIEIEGHNKPIFLDQMQPGEVLHPEGISAEDGE